MIVNVPQKKMPPSAKIKHKVEKHFFVIALKWHQTFLQWIQSALLFLSVEESILVNSKLLFIANDGGNIGNKKDYSAH